MWNEVFGDSGEIARIERERRLNAELQRQEKERLRKERETNQYNKKYEDVSYRKLYLKKQVKYQQKKQPQQLENFYLKA